MRTITLTNEQANLLSVYIILTRYDREKDSEEWAKLASKEADKEQAEVFWSNSRFYADLSPRLEEIRNIIDNSPWTADNNEREVQ